MATTMYIVKLGAYKNGASLKNEVSKLPAEAREITQIVQRGKIHFASSIETEDRKKLEKLLPLYKKVFSDAFIASFERKRKPQTATKKVPVAKPVATPKTPSVPKVVAATMPTPTPKEQPKVETNETMPAVVVATPETPKEDAQQSEMQTLNVAEVFKTSEPEKEEAKPTAPIPSQASKAPKIKEQNATLCQFVQQNMEPSRPKTNKVVNPKRKNLSLYERVHQKRLYLCAYAPDEWSPNILLEIDFFDDEVRFTPLQGNVAAKTEKYKIQNERIYISQDGIYDDGMYKTIEKITNDYYLLTTWIGTRKLTSIRYYFDLKKAKRYLATLK